MPIDTDPTLLILALPVVWVLFVLLLRGMR